MSIRLLIVDDHDVLREHIKSFLSKSSDFNVVGEAKDGEAAVVLARKLLPDIVLMDMNMPRSNGIEATGNILSNNNSIRIVILSANSDQDFVMAGFKAGISGYVLKPYITEDLIPALRAAMANELFLSPQIADASTRNHIGQHRKANTKTAKN